MVAVVHAFNLSTREAEADGSLWVFGQPGLRSNCQDSQGCYTEKLWLKKQTDKKIWQRVSYLLTTMTKYLTQSTSNEVYLPSSFISVSPGKATQNRTAHTENACANKGSLPFPLLFCLGLWDGATHVSGLCLWLILSGNTLKDTPREVLYLSLDPIKLTIKICYRAGEMAQRLRALTVLPEVLSSIPGSHMVAHNHLGWDLVPSAGMQGEDLYTQ